MTGVNQRRVWEGNDHGAREHVMIENRHQPTTIHIKTYVDERYKLTVYYNRDYGELFDLQEDPHEVNNLWGQNENLARRIDGKAAAGRNAERRTPDR